MAVAGNMLFGPVLMLFLMLCCFIFFAHLLGIPHGLLDWMLEKVTTWWDIVIGWGRHEWIVSFAQPHPIVVLLLVAAIVKILTSNRLRSIGSQLIVLIALTTVSACYLWLMSVRAYNNAPVATFNDKIIIIALQQTRRLIVIDNGLFSRSIEPSKRIEYELRPWLFKKYGNVTIDELRLTKPAFGTFKAAEAFCSLFTVKSIWVPWWEERLSSGAWRAYTHLRWFARKNNISLRYYNPTKSSRYQIKWQLGKYTGTHPETGEKKRLAKIRSEHKSRQ
jgi:hypothetical protein